MSYDTSCTHIERGLEADRTRVSLGRVGMHVCIISPQVGRTSSTRSGECHGSLHVDVLVLVHVAYIYMHMSFEE